MEKIYVFGYGSLLNPKSRGNTYEALDVLEDVELSGFQRKCNAVSEKIPGLYMNLVPAQDGVVVGVLTQIQPGDLSDLRKREVGYDEVDVTENIDQKVDGRVIVFIAPDGTHSSEVIYQTYLDTCLGGVAVDQRDQWIADTIIDNTILDDRHDPQYDNYVPLIPNPINNSL